MWAARHWIVSTRCSCKSMLLIEAAHSPAEGSKRARIVHLHQSSSRSSRHWITCMLQFIVIMCLLFSSPLNCVNFIVWLALYGNVHFQSYSPLEPTSPRDTRHVITRISQLQEYTHHLNHFAFKMCIICNLYCIKLVITATKTENLWKKDMRKENCCLRVMRSLHHYFNEITFIDKERVS